MRHFKNLSLEVSVLLRKSAVSQQQSGGLSLYPEVKVGELDVCHLDGAEEMNLS